MTSSAQRVKRPEVPNRKLLGRMTKVPSRRPHGELRELSYAASRIMTEHPADIVGGDSEPPRTLATRDFGGRPVLRDARHAISLLWASCVLARPQDDAEYWPALVFRFISNETCFRAARRS